MRPLVTPRACDVPPVGRPSLHETAWYGIENVTWPVTRDGFRLHTAANDSVGVTDRHPPLLRLRGRSVATAVVMTVDPMQTIAAASPEVRRVVSRCGSVARVP